MIFSGALIGRGTLLAQIDRPREGLVLLRGGHAMALAHGYGEGDITGRTLLTFFNQWDDVREGLRLAREGFDIARQIGSQLYGWSMVGNGAVCAIRAGEWDWAAAVLEEWIPLPRRRGDACPGIGVLRRPSDPDQPARWGRSVGRGHGDDNAGGHHGSAVRVIRRLGTGVGRFLRRSFRRGAARGIARRGTGIVFPSAGCAGRRARGPVG